MEKVKEFLINEIANKKLKTNNNKIEQMTRNQLKDKLVELMFDECKKLLECDEIIVERIKGGFGIGVNNNNLGLIPIEFSTIFKNLDDDLLEKADEYDRLIELKKQKALAKKKN